MSKKVMVTGADGFIGSHLTQQLIHEGYDVTAFCAYNSFGTWGWIDTFSKEEKDALNIIMGDIRDPNGVRTAMKGQDTVFHLAALIAIPFSYHSPDTYVDTNIKGTLNVLQENLTHAVFLLPAQAKFTVPHSMCLLTKSTLTRDKVLIPQQKSVPTAWRRAFTAHLTHRLQS